MKLSVMEYFYSIQGEGSRSGYPSIFIRLSKCNFTCPGFNVEYEVNGKIKKGCDSYYSVDTAFKDRWKEYNWSELVHNVNRVMTLSENNILKPDIVITGGEPTIYWGNEDFQNLLSYYISRGHKVTIETNASLDIKFNNDYQKEIMFSMSVKLSNSGEKESKRINIKNIENILEYTKDSYLKFVVDKETLKTTLSEIKNILKELPYYTKVYLMPKGDTEERVKENAEEVINTCMKYNFLYSDRIHIRVWDNKEGV